MQPGKEEKKERYLEKMQQKEKLTDICNQSKILNCKKVIPFASFVYFSNKMNFYMNDSINVPDKVLSI